MIKRLIAMMECAVLAGMLVCISPTEDAEAQWQVPNYSVPVGRGAGTGFKSAAPGSAGCPLASAGASVDPAFSCSISPTWTGPHQFNVGITSAAFQPAGVRAQIFTHDPTILGTIGSAVGNVGDWKFGSVFQPSRFTNGPVGETNYINNVWRFGTNVGTSSTGRIDDTKSSLGLTHEARFYANSVFAHEFHIEGVTTDGLTAFRPFSLFVAHDGSNIQGTFAVDIFNINDKAGNNLVQVSDANAAMDLSTGTKLRFGNNNVPAIQQKGNASAYFDLLFLDAGNVANIQTPGAYFVGARAGAAAPFPGNFVVFQPTTANSNDVILAAFAPTITGNIYGWRASGTVTGALIGSLRNDASGASSHARMEIGVGDGSAGDPYIYFTDQISKQWSIGLDNSASAFKISNASTLGSNDALAFDASRRALFTPAANSQAIQVTGYSLTGANAQSLLDLAGTWNTTGTPSAIKLNITNTASDAASMLMDLQTNGTPVLTVRTDGRLNIADGFSTQASGSIGWRSADNITASPDVTLFRDGAADTLALRRTTNAQIFRGYRTRTDASNYERWALQSGAGYFELAAETAGTGTDNIDLRLTPAGTGNVSFPGGTLLKTTTALTDGAAAATGTLTNAPTAGNPTKWIPINDNGTTRYVPSW